MRYLKLLAYLAGAYMAWQVAQIVVPPILEARAMVAQALNP